MFQYKEKHIDIVNVPYQYLPRLVCEAGRRGRTMASKSTKFIDTALREIYEKATRRSKALTSEDDQILITAQIDAGFSKIDFAKFDEEANEVCDYCNTDTGTLDHLLWQCPAFHHIRANVNKTLADLPMSDLMPCIKRGVAPVMHCRFGRTFWGAIVQTTSEEARKLIGVDNINAFPTDLVQELKDITMDGTLNARQALHRLKGPFRAGLEPKFPSDVTIDINSRSTTYENYETSELQEAINTYTDGGVAYPHLSWMSLAGIGIWVPNYGDDELHEEDQTDVITYGTFDKWGSKRWAPMPGQMCSSTRAETAAALVALMRQTAVSIGSDSAAMIAKAKKLQQAAREWLGATQLHWLSPKNPIGKPWGLQTDGDLWKHMWQAHLIRHPNTHALVKVKGHATEDGVNTGVATRKDQLGNDIADSCATNGIEEHGATLTAKYTSDRHEAYCNLMGDVRKIIVAVLKEEKAQRAARDAQKKLFMATTKKSTLRRFVKLQDMNFSHDQG